jgi:hypothetical protein
MRVMVGGVEIENLEQYGRLSLSLSHLHTMERRYADAMMGFGADTFLGVTSDAVTPPNYSVVNGFNAVGFQFEPEQIGSTGSRRVVHVPLLGIMRAKQLLPLFALRSLEIEIHLASMADASQSDQPNWEIVAPRMLYDTVRLADDINLAFSKHLTEGKGSLTIPFASWGVQKSTLAADTPNWDLVAARAYASIKSILVNGWREAGANPETEPRNKLLLGPMPLGPYDSNVDNVEVQLSVGAYRFPTVPSRGVGELAYRLRKAASSELGPLTGVYSPRSWYHDQWQVAFDLERLARESGDTASGMRTQGGSLLTVTAKNWGAAAATYAKELWLFVHCEAQLTVYGAGSDVAY